MKRLILLLFLPLMLYASETCVQVDWREHCPVAIDPNITAAILPPIPGDASNWKVVADPNWIRPPGQACDPQEDKFSIMPLTPHYLVTRDVAAGTWQIRGPIGLGENFIHVETRDKWDAVQEVIIVVIGVAPQTNTPPVLE